MKRIDGSAIVRGVLRANNRIVCQNVMIEVFITRTRGRITKANPDLNPPLSLVGCVVRLREKPKGYTLTITDKTGREFWLEATSFQLAMTSANEPADSP